MSATVDRLLMGDELMSFMVVRVRLGAVNSLVDGMLVVVNWFHIMLVIETVVKLVVSFMASVVRDSLVTSVGQVAHCRVPRVTTVFHPWMWLLVTIL